MMHTPSRIQRGGRRGAALLMCATVFAACSDGADRDALPAQSPRAAERPASSSRPLSVYTVNYPLAYFAERIGAERVEVHFPAPTDADPAYWSPGGDVVAAYQRADVILLNGAGYARWTTRATLPRAALVDTSADFTDDLIASDSALTHTHGPDGEHSHTELAFTTWLDPRLALLQAGAVESALSARTPSASAELAERGAALRADLEQMDGRLAALAGGLRRAAVLYTHPVYQYLDRRYALAGRSVHWEPREDPGAAQWAALQRELDARPAGIMLWEGEPLAATRERLEGLGVTCVVFPTLAAGAGGADYVAAMSASIERLGAAVARTAAP